MRTADAVLGGFHLAPFPSDYVGNVVTSLKEIDPDYVVPMHCTGEAFWDVGRQAMPGKLLRAYTGTEFMFSA